MCRVAMDIWGDYGKVNIADICRRLDQENFERVIALSNGQVLLDGPVREVLGQEEILAQTYVDPPQLTRLGKLLEFKQTAINQEEFLQMVRGSR